MGLGHGEQNSRKLNPTNNHTAMASGRVHPHGFTCDLEPMEFQYPQHQNQLHQNQFQHQSLHQQHQHQQQQHQNHYRHQYEHQLHGEIHKSQLPQQQQNFFHHQRNQEEPQSLMSPPCNDFGASGVGQVNSYFDSLQQLQTFQLQRVLPNHQQNQHRAETQASFGNMTGSMKQQPQNLIASAVACNQKIWGTSQRSGASSRHRNLLQSGSLKRCTTATSTGVSNSGNKNWNESKKDMKQSFRCLKKREQEKQRRFDLNDKFGKLIEIVKRIESEDEEIEQKRILEEEGIRKRKSDEEKEEKEETVETNAGLNNSSGDTSPPEKPKKKSKVDKPVSTSSICEMISAERRDFKRRFPCFISPSNRSDVIARSVSHLLKYIKLRKCLGQDLASLSKRVEEKRRENTQLELKLEGIEGPNVMANPLTNPMTVAFKNNSEGTDSAEKSTAIGATNEDSFPFSMTMNEDRMQQTQQQQTQMVMMMPMIVNPDGSFNQHYPQQFMPMPMISMGADQFNNMVIPPQPLSAGQQIQHLGQQQVQQQEHQDNQEKRQEANEESVEKSSG